MKIAVFIDEKGNLLPFYADGILRLYVYEKNKWTIRKEIPVEMHNTLNIAEVRNRILSIINDIEDCKIFVVAAIRGFPRSAFEDMGINIQQYKGILPLELLDQIKESVYKLKEEKVAIHSTPFIKGAIRNGIYEINLAKALESDTSLTSKMILIPFFQNTVFKKLEIVCTHLPKWFDKEFEVLKLQVRIEESTDGLCHAFVSPTGTYNNKVSELIDKSQEFAFNERVINTENLKCSKRCG